MSILSFETPKKLRSTEEHNEMFQSDSGIAGTYIPNMSEEDMKKFKAKHIKGEQERIEIKICIGGVNCNIFVYKNIYNPKYPKYPEADYGTEAYKEQKEEYEKKYNEWKNSHQNIKFSMNGKMNITFDEWNKINQAVEEAKKILKEKDKFLKPKMFIESFNTKKEMIKFIQEWNSMDEEDCPAFFSELEIYGGLTNSIPEDLKKEFAEEIKKITKSYVLFYLMTPDK